MDDFAFEPISSEAKDFIERLLVPQTTQRMTIHEALEHPWLLHSRTDAGNNQIPSQRYHKIRDAIRERYVSLLNSGIIDTINCFRMLIRILIHPLVA